MLALFESQQVMEGGVIITGVAILLKIIFDFVKPKKDCSKEVFIALEKQTEAILAMAKQTDDLHKWHDRDDEEGVKVWYVRKSLEDAIVTLAANIADQTLVMQGMMTELKDMRREIQK